MEGTVLLQGQTFENLLNTIREIVREEYRQAKAEELHEKFLSPKETCKLFQPAITVATLDNWADKGYLKKHYIGNLTFYKYSEVIESLCHLKKFKRK